MISRLTRAAGVFLACTVVVGCASTPGQDAGGVQPTADNSATRDSAAPEGTAQSTDPGRATSKPVTVAFGGDVHFEGEVADRLAADPQTALGPVADELSAADVAMVNLESAVTTGGSAAPKTYTFRAPPAAFRALDSAGVDVATMANNHGMDFGLAGFEDSLAAAEEHDFPVVGIGRDAARAYEPYVTTVQGQRLGFIGATQVLDSALVDDWTAGEGEPGLASAKDADRLRQAVRSARDEVDTLIVYLHWGRSMEPCPLDRQQQLARTLIDAGADVLVGTHAHRLLAGGLLRDSYVHYGLGNFVWYNAGGASGQTGVLTLALQDGEVTGAEWTPAVISGGVPRVLSGAEADEALAEWRDLRQCTDLAGPRENQ